MTTLPETEPILESALPDAPQKRDLFGHFCFYLHFAVMIYIVLGWLVAWKPLLIFYVVFLPLVFTQWQLNKNTCVLNNLESLIRTGSWRDPNNREEGAWLHTLVQDLLHLNVTKFQMDVFIYCVLGVLWLLGLGHLFWYAG